MAIVQQRFAINNIELKYNAFEKTPTTNAPFTPIAVDMELEKSNYPCPMVYVGAPMTTDDVIEDVAIISNGSQKGIKRVVISVSNTPTTTIITPSRLKDTNEFFDIKSTMEAFTKDDQSAPTKQKPMPSQNMNLINKSQSLVVNSNIDETPTTVQQQFVQRRTTTNVMYNRFNTHYQQRQQQQVQHRIAPMPKHHMIKTNQGVQKYNVLVKDPAVPGGLRKLVTTGVSPHGIIRIPGLTAHGTYIQSGSAVSFNSIRKINPNIRKVGNSVPVLLSSRANPVSVRTTSTTAGSKPVVIKLVDKATVSSPSTPTDKPIVLPSASRPDIPPLPVNCRNLAPKANQPSTQSNQPKNQPNILVKTPTTTSQPNKIMLQTNKIVSVTVPITTATSEPKAIITKTLPTRINLSAAQIAKKRKSDQKFGVDLAPSFKKLRTGIEITFEDGIRHFVTNLSDLLTMDDERFKRWSDIKKGDVIAAKWTDGVHYDAKVVECYFDKIERRKEKLEALKNKREVQDSEEDGARRELRPRPASSPSTNIKPATPSHPKLEEHKAIMCDNCKLVFTKIKNFRLHQKSKCHSTGTPVNMETFKIKMIDFNNAQSQNMTKETFKKPVNDKGVAMLKEGTKILHKWKLEDGISRWYQGTITKILGPNEDAFECEFQVEYEGEEDHGPYKLHLYEDYPLDIRIMS